VLSDLGILLKVIALLAVANGTPIFLKRLLVDRWGAPIDFGLVLQDGQPLFGRSKTIRGVLLATACSAFAAMIIGLPARLGALIGVAAMAGDLLSSFIKRRLKLAPSSQAPGLDQVPEALLPLLLAARPLGFGAFDIALGVALFWVGEIVLSRLFYWAGIRDRPY
jgi:CDP-diglyceride synthetase